MSKWSINWKGGNISYSAFKFYWLLELDTELNFLNFDRVFLKKYKTPNRKNNIYLLDTK
jgi:hypothetical protein